MDLHSNVNRSIVIIGSSNTDMVVSAAHIPKPGETILGGKFFMNPGGKGANQAVAARRLGGDVTFICKIGADVFGNQSKDNFQKEGIDTRFIFTDPVNASGVALITIDEQGQNSIVVAPGANAHLRSHEVVDALSKIENPFCILLQLETPMETVVAAAEFGRSKNLTVILNPAPATSLPDKLYPLLDFITPNEIEAEMLTGISVRDEYSAEDAARALAGKGIRNVVITRGAQGAFVLESDRAHHVPVVPVQAVDTTAAGDVFNGALAVALAEGKNTIDAVAFGCRAAAISVTRLGAQASAPYKTELTD